MSLCQPNGCNLSCGSCCGFFNLDLSKDEYKNILIDRTNQFEAEVDFKISHTIPAFRQSREKIEKNLPKKDESTYNCPFLGYLEFPSETKIGCMIHPARTGDPKSQNYSFYGSSICLGYECKNMGNKMSANWESLFAEISNDSIEYSQLSADFILVRKLESLFMIRKISSIEIFTKYREPIKEILKNVIKEGSRKNLTSFEVDYESNESEPEIIEWLLGNKLITDDNLLINQ